MILYHRKLKWFLESDSQMSKGILERTNASVSIICISGIIWTIEADYMTFYRIRPIKANRETRKITWSKGQKCWKCQNNFAWVQFICRNVLYRKTFQFQKLFCTKVTHLKINHVIECKEISQLNIGFMPKNIDGFQNSRYVSTACSYHLRIVQKLLKCNILKGLGNGVGRSHKGSTIAFVIFISFEAV